MQNAEKERGPGRAVAFCLGRMIKERGEERAECRRVEGGGTAGGGAAAVSWTAPSCGSQRKGRSEALEASHPLSPLSSSSSEEF